MVWGLHSIRRANYGNKKNYALCNDDNSAINRIYQVGFLFNNSVIMAFVSFGIEQYQAYTEH